MTEKELRSRWMAAILQSHWIEELNKENNKEKQNNKEKNKEKDNV